MPLDVISVSRHAQLRYRIQHPEARITDIHFAVGRAIPIDTALSFALAGRQPREVSESEEEHRLHVTGCGVFVICALPDEPGRGFVKTYLRLGAQQQAMARAWFLEPLKPLLRAFEMGFEAARRPGAPAVAAQAIDADGEALIALSARVVSPPAPPAPPRTTARIWHATWSPPAVQQLLSHQRVHTDLETNLKRWSLLTPDELARLRTYEHLRDLPCSAAYIEPFGRVVAFVVADDDGVLEVSTAMVVPGALREGLAREARPVAPLEAEAGVSVVLASELTVSSWSPRAVREASELGFAHIPVAWLSQLQEVQIEVVRQVAAELRWTLQAGCTYAARRSREHILLLRQSANAPASTVVRCGRIPTGID